MKQVVATIIWRGAIACSITATAACLLAVPVILVYVYLEQGLAPVFSIVGIVVSAIAFAFLSALLIDWARRNRKQ